MKKFLGFLVPIFFTLCGCEETRIVNAPVVDPLITEPCKTHYLLGDIDGDEKINWNDVDYFVEYMFKGGPPPACSEAADVNMDGRINSADITALTKYIRAYTSDLQAEIGELEVTLYSVRCRLATAATAWSCLLHWFDNRNIPRPDSCHGGI